MRFLNRAHRVAAFCGATPLALATVIFLLWLVTRQEWLMIVGLFLLYAGLGALVLGIACAVKAWWTARRDLDRSNRQPAVSIRACVLLLLANQQRLAWCGRRAQSWPGLPSPSETIPVSNSATFMSLAGDAIFQ
jgi:hypothetical protein